MINNKYEIVVLFHRQLLASTGFDDAHFQFTTEPTRLLCVDCGFQFKEILMMLINSTLSHKLFEKSTEKSFVLIDTDIDVVLVKNRVSS